MKTFYRIFGGKNRKRALMLFALFSALNIAAQPCLIPPEAFLTGGGTICVGSTTSVRFNFIGGTPPWRITYSINGIIQPVITGIMTSPYVLTTGVAGLYTGLSVFDNNNCTGSITGSPVDVIVNQLPVVDLGPDFYSCTLGAIPMNPSIQNYSTVTWTSTGNGTFSDPNSPNPIYYPGTNNISSGHAVITLTVYALSPCTGSVTDNMTVFIVPGPGCNAGADDTQCGTGGYTITGSSATDYSTLTWNSSGTGTFVNPGSLGATYFPSAADILAGTVTLTLTAYGTGNCLTHPIADQMVLHLVDAPAADAGPAAMVCEGSALTISDATASHFSSVNWTTSGTGLFVNGGTLSPTYTPGVNDINSGTVTLTLTANPASPCTNPVTSAKVITFSVTPTVNAGTDGVVCDNTPYTITNAQAGNYSAVLWTTSGSGTFSSTTSLNTTYTPGNSDVLNGSVLLTLTAFGDPACNLSASDQQLLTITSSPVIYAGGDDIACENSTFTITTATATGYSGVQWNTSGTGTLINANTLSPSYLPSFNDALVGFVTLTLSVHGNAPCNTTVSDAMQLTVIPLPVASAGNNLSICSTAPVTISNATAANYSFVSWTTSGTGTFNNANIVNPAYTASAADIANGTVILTMTVSPLAPCALSASDNLILRITPSPTAYAGLDNTSCDGFYLLSGTSATNFTSIVWTTSGTGVFNNATTLNPTYTASSQDIANGSVNLLMTVQAQSPCALEATDYMVLTLPGLPLADAGVNGFVCEGSDFQVTTASASNYGNLNWSTSGSGTFSGQNTLIPVYSPGASDIANGSVVLTLTAASAAPCTTTASDQMLLAIVQAPEANAGADQAICEGGSATLNGSVLNSSSYTWSTTGDGTFTNGSTLTPSYFPGPGDLVAGSTTITLTAFPSGACSAADFDNMILTIVKTPQVDAGSNQTICSNTYTLVSATASAYSSLLWTSSGSGSFVNAGSVNATYIASMSDISLGSITLTITATGNTPCTGTISDQMTLTFTPIPTVYAGQDASVCGNSGYTIADAYAANYSVATWSTSGSGTFSDAGDVNATYFPGTSDITAGFVTLTLTVTGFNLCNLTATDQMVLSFINAPVANAGPDFSSCGMAPFQITGASASDYSSILWTHNGTGVIQGSTGINPVYTPSQGDILNGQVTLTLHALANIPCTGEVTDLLVISLEPAPVVSAGIDMTICQNENPVLAGATAAGYATLSWTSSGSGTFSNNSTLNPVYYPGAADIAAGAVTLVLSATGIAPCNTLATDFMVLTINELPVANAGLDDFTCANSYQLSMASAQHYSSVSWTTSGTGLFTNPNVVNAVYTPGVADLANGSVILTLTVNGQSPCNSQSADNMTLIFGQGVMANAGQDGSTCGTTPFTVTTSSVSPNSTITWTSSGSGSFANQNTLNPTYTPGNSDVLTGFVILTMQVQGSAPCFSNAQDDMILGISAPATAYAGPDALVCTGSGFTVSGASAVNYAALTWSSTGSGTITGGNTLSPTYTPSIADYQNGSVVLMLTATTQSPCTGGTTDEMILTFADAASADAGPDAEICYGVSFTITGASATGASVINWTSTGTGTLVNANTINPTYIPGIGDQMAGSVILMMTVTGSAPCIGTATDNMTLTINSLPQGPASISGPQTVCAGQSGVIYSVNPPVLNATSYFWAVPSGATIVAGSNTASITVDFGLSSISGNIEVTPVNLCGNGTMLSYAVTVNPVPGDPGNIMGPDEVCSNTNGVQYSIDPLANATGYQWTVPAGASVISGNGTNTIIVDFSIAAVSGNITVSGTNSCGNGLVAVLAVNVLPIPSSPVITANGPLEFCEGGSVVLSATPGYASYLWSNGMTTQDITVTSLGTYSVVVTGINGCASLPSNEITVNVHMQFVPDISANGPTDFCEGGSVILSAPAGYASYLWNNGQTSQNITVTGSGVFNVTVTDALGCTSLPSADVTVTVSPLPVTPVITASGPLTFCAGGSVTLSAPTGYASYLWSNGETTQLITVNVSGNYFVVVTGINGCGSIASNTLTVDVLPLPVINAGADAAICEGVNYTLTDATAANYTSIYWTSSGTGIFNNPASVNPTYSPSQDDVMNGSVTLTLTVYGCIEVSDFMTLSITPQPTANSGGDLAICFAPAPVTGATASGYSGLQWAVVFGSGTLINETGIMPVYLPGAGDLTTGYAILSLTVFPLYPCGTPIIVTKRLDIHEAPLADAGIDEVICAGSSFIVTTATASNFVSVQWSSSGTGTWLNANTLNPTYIPSNADITTGTVNLTLTAVNSGCPEVTDVMVLTIQPEITVNAGPDGSTCEGSNFNITGSSATLYSSVLWTSSGTGTFSNATALNPVYTPGPADIVNGSVQLTLTGIALSPCTGTDVDVMTLFISQEPLANAGTDGTICQGEQYVIVDAVAASYASLNWATSGSGTFLSGTTLTPTYIPGQLDIIAGNVTLTLIASNPPCADVTDSQILNITPTATVDAGPDVTICQLCSHTVSGAFVNNALSFTWSSTGTGTFTGIQTFTPTYQPSAADIANGSVTLILTAESYLGCGSFSDQMVIYINQNPELDFTWSPVCEGQPTDFTVDPVITDINAIAVWHWNFGDGFYSNVINPSHTFPAVGQYNVTLTVTDTAGNSSIVSHIVEINSSPIAFFSFDTPNCLGEPTQFHNLSSTENGYINRWVWTYGDGSPADTIYFPNDPNVVHTYANEGIFEVILNVRNSYGCENTYSSQVTVTPAPVANFYYTTLCEDLLVNFQDASFPNGAGNVVSWAWDFDDPASGIFNTSDIEDPQHIFSAPGTYDVTLTITNFNNCTGTITKQVTVGGAPAVEFTWQTSCAESLTSFFTDPTVVNINAIAIFAWEFGDGGLSNLQDPQHMYAAAGDYSVMLTITDTAGCTSSVSHLVHVSPLPVAFFSYTAPTCFETETSFNDLSYAESGYITEWEWIFGDGNSTIVTFPNNQNVTHQYANAGFYNVTLNITTSEGCESTVTIQVEVIPNPVANFINTSSCLGEPVNFTDLSQPNGGGQIINWTWNFGDPTSGINNSSALQHPVHIYAQPGTYPVSLIVATSNSCADTMTRIITIAPAPIVDFVSTNGCSNDTVQFTSSTFVNPNTTLNWFWEFGDGQQSTDADPQHIYTSQGVYIVNLTITDTAGCSAMVSHPVSVIPGPVAMFSFTAPACSGNEVQFDDMSLAQGSVITSWLWDFGDGNTELVTAPGNPDVIHIYANAGVYTVTLSVTNLEGCDAATSMNVQIVTGPTAEFTFEQGCLATPVAFTDLTTTNGGPVIVQWLWNFGDPASGISNTSSLQNPLHIFNQAGTCIVTLTSTSASGCQDTVQHSIVITPLPAVAFLATGTCVGSPASFEPDPAVMDLTSIASYEWNFGDGSAMSTSASPTHIYNVAGTFNVTLTVVDFDGCTSSTTQQVTIGALPVAAFTYNSACTGNATTFNDLSYATSGEQIVSWSWVFNDPGALPGADTSSLQNPVYNFTAQGMYDVTLSVTTASGCPGIITIPVQVFPAPTAAFNYTTNACANGAVSFQDASSTYMGAITAWEWEFAVGYTSTLQNPYHIFYHTDSTYSVRLIVTDMRGCIDTLLQDVYIPAGLEVAIDFTTTCSGDSTWFSPVVISPVGNTLVAFQWNFDDPASGTYNSSTLRDPVHYFQNNGSYLVSLLATDINNCQTTVYQRIEVEPLPIPAFSYTAGTCDSTIYFTDLSNGNGQTIASWIWSYGDGSSDTLVAGPANTTHFYTSPGIYDVSLTTINENGCLASFSLSVERMPCITSGFTQQDTLTCERHALSFEDHSVCAYPISNWAWDFGDGETFVYNVAQPSVTHVYQLSGTYSVQLVVSTTLAGITVSDTSSQTVKVIASPLAGFMTANVCLNSNTIFTDQSTWTESAITGWNWDFGDPHSVYDTTSIRNPAYRYTRAGSYTAFLTVTNEFGCTDTVSHELQVNYLPVADFSYSLACQNNHTLFTDISDTGDATIDQWWWKFRDSLNMLGMAGVQNPDFIFRNVGKYEVDLIVINSNGCSDTVTHEVVVNPKPISAFSMTENYENIQGRVLFTNGSIGANAYVWDFNTGIQSYEVDPVVDFASDGEYEISLVTLNEFDCPDTLKMDYTFMFKGLWIPNAFSPSNPNASVRLFKAVGVNLKSYMIEVYDTWGNILWTSKELDENGSPSEGWDGRFNNNLVQQDVYMWKASAIFKDGSIWQGTDVGKNTNIPQKTYGTVTLVR